ncbi:MAG: hypothetical protein WCZ21_07330, partial [Bacteroidales bacterium]
LNEAWFTRKPRQYFFEPNLVQGGLFIEEKLSVVNCQFFSALTFSTFHFSLFRLNTIMNKIYLLAKKQYKNISQKIVLGNK